jgi:hypothetical protein
MSGQLQAPAALPLGKGRAIVQAVSRWLPTAEDRVRGVKLTTSNDTSTYIRGGLISLWLYEEDKLRNWKNVFTLHIPRWAPHTCDFVVLISLTHPWKILLVVLQIGKAEDLSASLRICGQRAVKKWFKGAKFYANHFGCSRVVSWVADLEAGPC